MPGARVAPVIRIDLAPSGRCSARSTSDDPRAPAQHRGLPDALPLAPTVLGYIEEAYSEMVGSASYGTAEATAVPALEARIAALEGLIDQVRSQLPSSTRALAAEADTGLLETPPAEPELVLVRGTNRHAKAIQIRASCAAGQPSDAWRTRCGWAFTAAYAFEEVALDEAERAPSEKCPRCWKARDAAEP